MKSNPIEEPILDAIQQRRVLLYMNNGDKSDRPYEVFAWQIYDKIVRHQWFEGFVLLNILLVGIATGVDLDNEEPTESIADFVKVTAIFTLSVFTAECVLKIISYGYSPQTFFTDEEDGSFNTFDFIIVVLSFCFLGSSEQGAVSALRLLRLLRLLTFIKVRELFKKRNFLCSYAYSLV